jgi:hypothetical protein
MSADNIIYVKKIRGKWWVWHDSASNDKPKPKAYFISNGKKKYYNQYEKSFESEGEALEYAFDLEEEIGYVEYNVCKL